jgi:hypothetical protein
MGNGTDESRTSPPFLLGHGACRLKRAELYRVLTATTAPHKSGAGLDRECQPRYR